MVQATLDAFLDTLRALASLAGPLLLLGLAALAVLVVLALLDRRRPADLAAPTARLARQALPWLFPLFALVAAALVFDVTRRAADLRLASAQSAENVYRRLDGRQTVQPSPRVYVQQERTYVRSLLLPRDFLDRLGEDAPGALAPYLTDPTSETVTSLRDRFRRSGPNVVFTREATLLTESPVTLDLSEIAARLARFDLASEEAAYNATFEATYAFKNPLTAAATMRFNFPLPANSGTLSDFRVRVNGAEAADNDLSDGFDWLGEVAGGGEVRVAVSYKNQGARGWTYDLGTRREAIRNFRLRVSTDLGGVRAGPYPTATTGGLRGTELRWDFRDVITSRDIALTFDPSNVRETLGKAFGFAPLALALFLVFAFAWAARTRSALSPLALGATVLAFAADVAALGILSAYLPPVVAGLLGALLCVLLALPVLGRGFAVPLAFLALSPLVFFSGGHAGLLLLVLCVAALFLLQGGLRRALRPAS